MERSGNHTSGWIQLTRRIVAAAASTALAVSLGAPAHGQQAANQDEGERYEGDFFTVAFPSAWTVDDLGDQPELGRPRGLGFSGRDHASGVLCVATAMLGQGSLEQYAENYAALVSKEGREVKTERLELPNGAAWRVDASAQPAGGDPRVNVTYIVELGLADVNLNCRGLSEHQDRWASIAGGLESRLPQDGLELGWPDVPLIEQQTWARISSVPGIARRQVAYIVVSYDPDMPWYVSCKDRLHHTVPLGEGGWNAHVILRVIEGGAACWATRNPASTEWDYSDWTTPHQALEERFNAQIDRETERRSREGYEWECTIEGYEPQLWWTEDKTTPVWFELMPELCVITREPLVERP